MANFSLRSPGFFAREIEVFPVASAPQPGGAGAVGTANLGPAFIPVTLGSIDALQTVFGTVNGKHQGLYGGREFLRQGGASFTYMRVLGAGTDPRAILDGADAYLSHTPNAGFVVGQPQYVTSSIDDDYIVGTVNQFTSSNTRDILYSAANNTSAIYFLGATFGDSTLAKALSVVNTVTPQINNVPELLDTANPASQFTGEHALFVTSSLYTFSGAGSIRINFGTTIATPVVNLTPLGSVTGSIDAISTTYFDLTSSAASTIRWSAFDTSEITAFTASNLVRGVIFTYGSGTMPYKAVLSSTLGYAAFGEMVDGYGAGLNSDAEVADGTSKSQFRFAVIDTKSRSTSGFYQPTANELKFGPVICSMNPNESNYFANVLNKDPGQFVTKGHLLYANFDVMDSQVSLTGSLSGTSNLYADGPVDTGVIDSVSASIHFPLPTPFFCVPPQGEYNRKWHNFVDRYARPASPLVFSQPIGGVEYDLFRVISKHDGVNANSFFKVSVSNIRFATSDAQEYPTFALEVRAFNDNDHQPVVYEKFTNLTLNPNSDRFFAKIIGDSRLRFEFDRVQQEDRKLVEEGEFPSKSNYVYLEPTQELLDGRIPREAVPFGFAGIEVPNLTTVDVNSTPYNVISLTTGSFIVDADYIHIFNLSGSIIGAATGSYLGDFTDNGGTVTATSDFWLPVDSETFDAETLGSAEAVPFQFVGDFTGTLSGTFGLAMLFDQTTPSPIVPPVPYRLSMTQGSVSSRVGVRRDLGLYWGFQTTETDFSSPKSIQDPNASLIPNAGIVSNLMFFGVPETGNLFTGSAADSHSYNKFSLANVELGPTTANTEAVLGSLTIADAVKFRYKRDGVAIATGSFADLISIGGQNGPAYWNKLSAAAKFTMPVRGGFDGVNVQNRDANELNAASVAASAATGSFGDSNEVYSYNEAIRTMLDPDNTDIEVFAVPGIYEPLVTNTTINGVEATETAVYIMDLDESQSDTVSDVIDIFEARGLDSSWAATYFPSCRVPDPTTGNIFTVCPSSVVLGAIALNDRLGQPWFAAAGISRGALDNVESTTYRLRAADRDNLYDANINPIIAVSGEGYKVWGQKTLSQDIDSALNRLNVRRLMIRVRKICRNIGRNILFNQYTPSQVDQFQLLLKQAMGNVQKLSGISAFKIQLAPDYNSNTLSGKITLIPTKSIEFVVIDFIIDSSGITFG